MRSSKHANQAAQAQPPKKELLCVLNARSWFMRTRGLPRKAAKRCRGPTIREAHALPQKASCSKKVVLVALCFREPLKAPERA